MSFVQGIGSDEQHPIVIEAGLPSLPLFPVLKAHIPLTSPARRRMAAQASGLVGGLLVLGGLLAVTAVVRHRRRR